MKSFLSSVTPLVLIASAITLSGCSGIRVVRSSPEGGEIALLGMRDDAMETARQEMASNCGGPGRYRILEQGEVVVGQTTQGQATADTDRSRRRRGSRTVVTTSETTQDVTEWRVKYACVADQPTAMIREVRVRF